MIKPIEILTLIFIIGIAILGLALFFLLKYHSKQPQAYRWLAYALLFSLLCDLCSVVLRAFGLSSNIGGITYNIGFLTLYSVFFYRLIGGRRLKMFMILINGLYVPWAIYNAIFIQKLGINSYSTIAGSLMMLILCVIYYFHLLRELPVQQVYQLPFFWVISSLFFVTSGKLVMYSVINYLTNHYDDNLIRLWIGHNSLTII
jgi:hypothetical protein